MADFEAVTDDDLARARSDPEFRAKLLTTSLDRLLKELHKLQRAGAQGDAERTKQIKEGVDLAVKLADRIHGIAKTTGGPQAA